MSGGAGTVIAGGGFAGLYAAKELGRRDMPLTLVDRRNFHLFQPLLYQVATGGLSPGDISYPLRSVLRRHKRTIVRQSEVTDFRPDDDVVVLSDGELRYDTLVVATGVRHHYFGNDGWETIAGGLKSIEDALVMRRRIFAAFERAEKADDVAERESLLTFAVVGGGPTGVELAGALAELTRKTLREDFRHIDPTTTRILLVEGTDRVLPSFPKKLSRLAAGSLQRLDVDVKTDTMVTTIDADGFTAQHAGASERIASQTVLWAAGVQASPPAHQLAERTGAKTDKAGCIYVREDLTIDGYDNIYVVGDLAHVVDENGNRLPGMAPVAMQQGSYVARRIATRGEVTSPFRFRNKGQLAVIGRNAAVADLGRLQFGGFPAWIIWVVVHIRYLIVFDKKLLVLLQWAINYVTRKRGARLITNVDAGGEG